MAYIDNLIHYRPQSKMVKSIRRFAVIFSVVKTWSVPWKRIGNAWFVTNISHWEAFNRCDTRTSKNRMAVLLQQQTSEQMLPDNFILYFTTGCIKNIKYLIEHNRPLEYHIKWEQVTRSHVLSILCTWRNEFGSGIHYNILFRPNRVWRIISSLLQRRNLYRAVSTVNYERAV